MEQQQPSQDKPATKHEIEQARRELFGMCFGASARKRASATPKAKTH